MQDKTDYIKEMSEEISDPYMMLSMAVIRQAVNDALDFDKVLNRLHNANPGSNTYNKIKIDMKDCIEAREFMAELPSNNIIKGNYIRLLKKGEK